MFGILQIVLGRERKNGSQITPYIEGIKDWKIREMIVGYFEAKGSFKKCNPDLQNGNGITFQSLQQLQHILEGIKENQHLIFERTESQKGRLKRTGKVTPNADEARYINNVGLLFHRVVVVKELKYILENYDEDSVSYEQTRSELERNIAKIDRLFHEGIDIIKNMMRSYAGNMALLTYIMEHKTDMENSLGENWNTLAELLLNGNGLDNAYFKVGVYYLDSGWKDRAKAMFEETLKMNPNHELAKSYLNN